MLDTVTSPASPMEPLGSAPTSVATTSSPQDNTPEPVDSERALVKVWQDKVKKAKEDWGPDFDRMRANMDFVAGLQWNGQKTIADDRYVVNLTLRTINQAVASLYAKNPTVQAKRRPKLDFEVWDGNMETIQQAVMMSAQIVQQGIPVPPELDMLMADFTRGRDLQKLIDKVGKTLELVFQYQMDSQTPDFKTQMKQLVRRVLVCGVGYIKVLFCRDYDTELTQSETRVAATDRAKMATVILQKLAEGKITEDDAEIEQLRSLVASLGTTPLDQEAVNIKEKLIFDFPQATSIIPDTDTRMLKGFVGAHWLAEEYYLSLDTVNAFFELEIEPDEVSKSLPTDLKDDTNKYVAGENARKKVKKVRLWKLDDLDTKSTFIICDGYKDFILKPEVITPSTKNFWTTFAVTFNDIEVEDGCEASIFPPSSVDLIRSAQKEWNRTRQALRRHRVANGPRYIFSNAVLSDEDLDKIENSEDQSFFPLKGILPGQEPGKVIQPLPTLPVAQELYDTEPLREDTLLATGQQEANIGPAQPNVTATVGTIAEQSRQSVAASDVDGFDDSLTAVAACGSEMILQEFSKETVAHIAGIGNAWPEQDKTDFLNELMLEVKAASSGRPNKAIEIANWEKIAGLLVQFGANPQAVIRKTIEVYDSDLEPADFYPLPMPAQQGEENGPGGPPGGPSGPPPQGPPAPPGPPNGQGQMMPSPMQGPPP